MEVTRMGLTVIAHAVGQTQRIPLTELNDLQLVLVGGGVAELAPV